MIHKVDLPKTTTLVFSRGEDVILTAEAVYLDALIASAQASSRRSKLSEDDRLYWLGNFAKLVNEKYQTDLSHTEAWVVARSTFMISDTLKKNFESLAKSLTFMDSTPSSCSPINSKDSTSTSPACSPVENVKTEYESNPSPPNGCTT